MSSIEVPLDNAKEREEVRRKLDEIKKQVRTNRAAKKSLSDAAPAALPDPHGVAFTDEELAALTDTDGEEAVKLAFARSTPEKQALLGAKQASDGEA